MYKPMEATIRPIIKLSKLSLFAAFALTAATSQAQMQWSSYDTSGNLITANVATGGDLASSTSVTFTIPANTELIFVTKNFTPFSIAGASIRKLVTFNASASGGFAGITQRTMGWGLYNSAGTASVADDVGYFGLWNGAGPYLETYDTAGSANLMAGTHLGQGTANTGNPSNGVTYTNQIQLVMNAAANGISEGTSSSTIAAAGLGMNGPSVTERAYTNPVQPPVGNATTFDEFAFMFNNTTGSPVTVTLSNLALGNSLTWDASGANPAAPTDGSGNWSTTNANWSSTASDTAWSSGYNAVIGAGNGAAGIINITNTTGVVVSNLTFNAAGSGNYTIVGSPLMFTGTPTVTVANGIFATNSAPLGGTGFTKAGNGTLVLLPSVAATNVGATTVNGGTLFLAGTGVNSLNDDLIVNTGALVQIAASLSIPTVNKLTINGGAVTNVSASNPTLIYNVMTLDNGGIFASAGAQIGQLNVTNLDLRAGIESFAKFPSTMVTNFTVKSTPGTAIVQSRANSSGLNGIAGLRINAGTFICDYANPAPNGDTQGGAKYVNTAQMVLAGGTVFQRFSANANRTETVGGVLINPGATTVLVTNNGPAANNYTFAQGVISRVIGGTVDYSVGGTSTGTKTCTTTTANVNGIIGGFATYAGGDWAAGTTIAAYSLYTTNADPTTWVAANNVILTGNPISTVPGGTSINTLKLGGASTVTLGGTFTLATGGLLATGSGANSVTGGTLTGSAAGELIVHQYSTSDLNISSTLADSAAATSLTKSGFGKLIVSGTVTLTGTNYLNGGTVEVGSLSQLASGPLIMNNGALRYTGSDVASTRAITLNGVGGTFDVAGSATVTQTSPVLGGGGFNSTLLAGLNLGDWGGLTKLGSGTLVLSVNNVYNGPTVVSNGVLVINGTNTLTGTSGLTNYTGGGSFTVYGGSLSGTGAISGPIDLKNGGTLAAGFNNAGALTVNASLIAESGSTNQFSIASGGGNTAVTVTGNLTIGANSTIALNITGSPLPVGTYTLITYSGTKSGSFNATPVILGGSINGSYLIDGSTPGQIRLIVIPQVVITSQPTNTIVSIGQTATFTVGATGTAPLAYQWYEYSDANGDSPVAQSGATGSSFSIVNAQTSDSGFYGVVVTNNFNSVTSSVATLIVGNVAPQITGPTNTQVIAGNNVTFSTTVTLANPAPTFQWLTNGVNVTGATSTSLTLTSVPQVFDGMQVSVIASNIAGNKTNSATLSVIQTPAISPQPTNLTVNVGDTANFISGASGVPAPTYQWYKNNVAIPSATASTLTIANAQGSDIANYMLIAANAAGTATSAVVKLTVDSTSLASTALSPGNGSTGVCYDTPLYVTFNNPIGIVNSGKVRIYDSTNSTTPVDTIDMSSNSVVISSGIGITNNIQAHSLFSGDTQVINYFPVIINGTTAAIYPHGGVMTSNHTYYVTMDNGVVADSSGAYFAGISDTNAWRFSTKAGGPVNPTNILVAADGTGDFVTVQGAVDSLAPGNTAFTVVTIHNGNYVEIVDISGKNNITFRGQTRTGVLVGYPNNNNLTGTTAARMAFKVNGADIKLENLTITNGTPQGGSQAEALLIYNNGLRCVVNNCDIISRQDTILINASTSQGYFYNCKVIGNFDYIWGVGVGFFDHCVFHTITNAISSSYNFSAARTLTASSSSTNTPWANPNPATFSANGFSFFYCTLEADAGVTGITLAGSNGTAGGLDAWISCLIDTNAYVSPSTALSNTYVFWQHGNSNIIATVPVTYTNVQVIGVTNNDPRLIAASTPIIWFYGWLPQLPGPVAGAASYTRNAAVTSFNINIANLLTHVTDLAGDPFSLASTGVSTNGVTLVTSGGNLIYNNGNPVADQFTYTVSDSYGGMSTGTVTINIDTQPLFGAAPMVVNSGANAVLTFGGVPTYNYSVERSTNLNFTPFDILLITNAPAGGLFQLIDSNTLPQMFYREIYNQ